jgi:hypothetical protein
MMGTVEDGVLSKDSYLLFGNFVAINDENGKWIENQNKAKTNCYIIKVNAEGVEIKRKLIQSDNSFYAKKIYKVNNETIDILGYTGSYDHKAKVKSDQAEKLVYILTNSNLYIIGSSKNF